VLPLHLFETERDAVAALAARGVRLGVQLPRGARDGEFARVAALLQTAKELGAVAAVVANLGHLALCAEAGLPVIGDLALNLYNSQAMETAKELGLAAVTASCELSFPQLRDLGKPLPTGLFAYGRLPLMLTENCLGKNAGGCQGDCKLPARITDRTGAAYPVFHDGDSCRNLLLNPKTLWLADRRELFTSGLHFLLLSFTTESAAEAETVLAAYLSDPEDPLRQTARPEDFTRGLLTRGVL
ncbi:MAG: U32 family peptidase, partial [Clostridia bacterium]|nr:U32 family peptidase [Clostridia bacterium]